MMSAALAVAAESPPSATEPAEVRGSGRDDVRLLIAGSAGISHRHFTDLPDALRAGDLLVVNASATLPAALPTVDGRRVHVSTQTPGGFHVVEVRVGDGPVSHPANVDSPQTIAMPGRGQVVILDRYPARTGGRLWLARLDLGMPVPEYMERYGEPIRYPYITRDWPIEAYQTVFATVPGSAEMPSAGRPFTHEMVTRLAMKGVNVAPIVLHTGVSSLEAGEPPYEEWFRVPETTAALVNSTKRRGGRVIAVGTTVVRALESTSGPDATTHPGDGWTDLVIGPHRPVFAVDGILTGWHQPESSHLDMLNAMGGEDLIAESYEAAVAGGYWWHEFGDVHLVLPEGSALGNLRAA